MRVKNENYLKWKHLSTLHVKTDLKCIIRKVYSTQLYRRGTALLALVMVAL